MIEFRASILIGMPTLGTLSHHLLASVVSQTYPAMVNVSWQMAPGHTTAEARNRLMRAAQDSKFRYIFFWDDDVAAPRFCLHHLYTLMEMHPEWTVLSGVYGTKSYPCTPLIYKEWGEGTCWDWKLGEIFPVKLGAMGLSMIRVADLDKLEGIPEYDAMLNGEHVRLKRYFHDGRGINDRGGTDFWTEDVPFAQAIEAAGLKWYVDASEHTIGKHVDMRTNTVFSIAAKDGVVFRPDPLAADYKICNLGSGKFFFNGSVESSPTPHIVTVDLNEEAHPTFRCDVRVLPTHWRNTFDEVWAKHVLEHIRYEETDETLEEWVRIVKPGGLLRIVVPDLKALAERLLSEERLTPELLGGIYGDQRSKYWNVQQDDGVHLAGFTPQDLAGRLQALGLTEIDVLSSPSNYVMEIKARKPDVVSEAEAVAQEQEIPVGSDDLGVLWEPATA